MALRRRKPPTANDEQSEPLPECAPGPARKKKPISPTSTSQSRRRTIPPRLRSLIFVSPFVLIGWYLLSRSHAPRALGRQYAVCSRSSDGIITMNAHELRTQCLVVSDFKIVATGTIDDIREQFGDKDTFGNDGIRIRWLNPRETVLPGLQVRFYQSSSSHPRLNSPGLSRKHRIDAHAHMLQYGESQSAVNLVGATSMAGENHSSLSCVTTRLICQMTIRGEGTDRSVHRQFSSSRYKHFPLHSRAWMGSDQVCRPSARTRVPHCCKRRSALKLSRMEKTPDDEEK